MGFLRALFGGSTPKPGPVEVDAWLLEAPPDAELMVVGESHYQPALMKVAGGKTDDGAANPDQKAALIPEPNNPYDKNAVAIGIDGLLVGYLARADAIAYAPVVRFAASHGRVITARARITGGWDRGHGDTGSFGVVLNLGTPGECMNELLGAAGQPIVASTDHPFELAEAPREALSVRYRPPLAGPPRGVHRRQPLHPQWHSARPSHVGDAGGEGCDDCPPAGHQAGSAPHRLRSIDDLRQRVESERIRRPSRRRGRLLGDPRCPSPDVLPGAGRRPDHQRSRMGAREASERGRPRGCWRSTGR